MDTRAFTNPSGRIVRTLQGYDAFVPAELPRRVELDAELVYLLSEADRALGELAGMAGMLPNPQLLIAPLSQREAVLSSRIEGTRASVSDLAILEAGGETGQPVPEDTLEVLNYRRAMNEGLARLDSLPLSLRLVRDLHSRLLTDVRGQEKTPGQFRNEQNWIGIAGSRLDEASYVPPPPSELPACLGDWESFLHEDLRIPPIIRCALMHYQFEAIHPFLDGNGRVGRLLIVLFLCTAGHLPSPVLYLSPFFEEHRDVYYGHLRAVSERSAWNDWFEFFTRAVIVQSRDGLVRSRRMLRLHEDYRRQLLREKAPPSAQRLVDQLFETPATTAAMAADRLSLTVPGATRAIQVLIEHGIIQEITGRRRDRVYVAPGLIEAIEADRGVE